MTELRKKLSDILGAGNGGNFRDVWNSAVPADNFGPLPPGDYTFRILIGELFKAKTGTPGYKLTLEVIEGEHEGRRAWHDLWLTPAALPMTKRDLAKIGVTNPEQLEKPLPGGILVRGRLSVRRNDDGNDGNRLTRFECIGTEPGDAFEPPADGAGQADAFPFGTNAAPTPNGTASDPPPNGKPPAVNGTPARFDLLPPDANGEADAERRAADFLRREKGGRP